MTVHTFVRCVPLMAELSFQKQNMSYCVFWHRHVKFTLNVHATQLCSVFYIAIYIIYKSLWIL